MCPELETGGDCYWENMDLPATALRAEAIDWNAVWGSWYAFENYTVFIMNF